jgi:hypothetical protein
MSGLWSVPKGFAVIPNLLRLPVGLISKNAGNISVVKISDK